MTPVTSARGAQPQPRPPGSGRPGGGGPVGGRPGSGRPGGGGPGGPPAWSPLKALVLLVVALGLGIYLVTIGNGAHAPRSLGTTGTTSNVSTQTPPSSTPPSSTPGTTTTTTAPPGGVQPSKTVTVLVANASQTNGIAAYFSSKLSGAGWGTLTPATAATTESSSAVYYASGRQQDALAVASTIGVASSAVQPLSGAAIPVVGATRADIVVVAGDDLASTVSSAASSSGPSG